MPLSDWAVLLFLDDSLLSLLIWSDTSIQIPALVIEKFKAAHSQLCLSSSVIKMSEFVDSVILYTGPHSFHITNDLYKLITLEWLKFCYVTLMVAWLQCFRWYTRGAWYSRHAHEVTLTWECRLLMDVHVLLAASQWKCSISFPNLQFWDLCFL